MLQIRLNKGSVDAVIGAKPMPGESVTVACPDHLVLADLPVAKGLGSATFASIVKVVGRKSRRQLTERVHFCARCDYPIAIYGRLSPCEHAFCLDCARSDSICYLCDERIQKIQTIKMMEGILICAAPDCLKSFLKKVEFESHIHNSHANLLQLNMKQENKNESETSGAKQSLTLDTALRGPPRPSPPPSNFQLNDDKGHRLQPPLRPLTQPKPPSQYHGQVNPSEGQPDWHMGMDGSTQTRIQQLNTDSQGVMQQESSQIPLKQQQGLLPDRHHDQSSLYPQQPPNFPMPVNGNPMMFAPRPFGFPPIQSDGGFPIFGALAPYEPARSEQTQEERLEQGPVLGFTPGPGRPSFMEGYPHPWNGGPNVSFEASQAGQGLLAAQQGMPPPPPPPGPPPPHLLHHMSTDRQSNGWPLERRDSFRGSQD